MVDMGVLRKYLDRQKCRMSVDNVQKLLSQIAAKLPMQPTKTILYCSFGNKTQLVTPFPDAPKALIDASLDKQILSLKGVDISAGKTAQDKWYPYILKTESWH